MNNKLMFFDFEVFKHDWLVAFRDEYGRSMTIINNTNELKEFYKNYREHIFVGYNCRHYDQYLFKGLILGLNPYNISQYIIKEEKQGYTYSNEFRNVSLYIFDCMFKPIGLKTLEGFMGLNIHESPISFDINRPLNKYEIDEVKKYCHYDVACTKEVFNHQIEEYNAHTLMIDMFNLHKRFISNTIANVSVSLFGATYQNKILYHDEFDLDLPELPTLQKYRVVRDWFNNKDNHSYKYTKINTRGNEMEVNRELVIEVAGIEHIFAWGGVHGSRDNQIIEGIIVNADVEAYYPSIMTQYNTLSRNVPNVARVKELKGKRNEYKAQKDPRQLPIKRALNSLYGKSKDKTSPAYDPRQANRTCVYGQLFLLDLIELLEDHIILINTNTDGIIFQVKSWTDLEIVKHLCNIWQERTKFILSFTLCSKIVQKDVNNYILIKSNDEYEVVDKVDFKSTGAYVKKLSDIDNDLPIINHAIIDYFVKGIAVEDTIGACTKLMQFQQLCKVSNLYLNARHMGKDLHERVFRVFAVKEDGGTLWKLKAIDKEKDIFKSVFDNVNDIDYKIMASEMDIISMELKKNLKTKYKPITVKQAEKKYTDYINGYKLEKIANTPNNCIIINEDVRHKKIFANLDKDWYVELAKKRINDFTIGKKKREVTIIDG